MKRLALALRVASLAGFCCVAGLVHAQSDQPQVPGSQVPGFQSPPASTGQPAIAPGEAKIVKSDVERKGRVGFDTFLSTYLTLSKECKVGANPKVEVTTQPKNGKITMPELPVSRVIYPTGDIREVSAKVVIQ